MADFEITKENIDALIEGCDTGPLDAEVHPVQDISTIVLPENCTIIPIGKVTGVVDGAVMVQNNGTVIADLESLLVFTQDPPRMLGRVDDVIGLVDHPLYVVYREAAEVADITPGMEVGVITEDMRQVPVNVLKQQQLTDAEPGAEDEFSDDEEEQRHRRQKREKKKAGARAGYRDEADK